MTSISSSLEDVEKSIQRLEASRTDLLRQLEQVDKALESDRARYAQLRNQSIAVHSLPNELLALLFGVAHASIRYSRSDKADLNALKFLLETSRVCTRWREIILSTPLLWNTVIMTVDVGFKNRLPAQEYLLAHLRRSGDAYLDMILSLQTDQAEDVDLFFTTLRSHSHRWRHMSIEIASANVGVIKQHLESVETPILQHFSLDIWETSDKGPTSPRTCYPTISPTIFINGAPNLSVLRLANAALGNLHPNSSSIRTLHIGGWDQSYFSWTQFKNFLESLPHLENLSLHELCIRHYMRNPLNEPSPVHVPNLKCLRLHKPFTPVHQIMPLLILPRLEQVSLHELELFECPPIPSVTYLHIDRCPFDFTQSKQLVEIFPNLIHLSLDEYVYQIYELFRPTSSSSPTRPCMWKSLQTLSVKNLVTEDVAPFVNMVVERKRAGCPISTVRLDRRSRAVLRLKHRWDLLTTSSNVVPWDTTEPWPPGLGYDDPHDLIL